jgi:hypothetical protein
VNLFFKTLSLCSLVFFGNSCSMVGSCTDTKQYRIEYSSGGGFTGIESGITITCNRSVKYWKRTPGSTPIVTDSLELTSAKLKVFNNLLEQKELFTYTNDYHGNYTARLTVVNSESTNSFSFNPSELPKDMPEAIKNIIAEIKNIAAHQ